MSPMPRVSVVIPHLNEPEDLRRCLASLARQRCSGISFETIVVDNGSRAPPTAVCAAFPGTRLEIETVPGPGPARNKGAAVAVADIIAFIDADCVADPGWVSALVLFLDGHGDIAFVGGDIRLLPARPRRLSAVEAYESIFSYRAREYVERHGYAATGNMAVRAAVFRAVGPFGGIGTMEDTRWGQLATAKGFRAAFLPEAKVATSACASFGDLARRWDRHVAHEFGNLRRSRARRLLWALKTGLVLASPAAEVPRVLRSDRVSGLRARLLAFACLCRVRLHRARRMVGLMLRDDSAATVGAWNRE